MLQDDLEVLFLYRTFSRADFIKSSVDVDFLCPVAKSCTKLTVLNLSKVCITNESATKLIDIFVQFQDLI